MLLVNPMKIWTPLMNMQNQGVRAKTWVKDVTHKGKSRGDTAVRS